MIDPNMKNFYGRLDRIERTHAAGGGFEAVGTLGMSYYSAQRRRARRGAWIMPVAMVVATVVGLKAGMLATIGPDLYQDRVAMLSQGGLVDQAGAYVLEAGPITVWLSDQMRGLVR